MSEIIIVDTEYTTWKGALESDWAKPWQHKEIVQIAAVKVDASNNFAENAYLDILSKPEINTSLSGLFTELTGITQNTLNNEGLKFKDALSVFFDFCDAGTLPVLCMNGDEAVFLENCKIHKTAFPFTQPFHRLRPFLEQQGVDMNAHSSGTLHRLTDTPLDEGHVHYALHDVRSMACYLNFVTKNNLLKGVSDLPTNLPTSDPRANLPSHSY